jgi:hypothetical protein
MTFEEIKEKIRKKSIDCEQGLEELAKIGYCLLLLNDDNGHWAVTFDGLQSVPMTNKPEDIVTTLFIQAKYWKDSIYEALIYALDED